MASLFSFAVLATTAALILPQSSGEENSLNPVDSSANEEARSRSEQLFRRMLPSLPSRNANRGRKPDIEALRQSLQNGDWSQVQSAPSPSTEEISCFVEVQLTQKIPGRCTRLGGRIPACQARDIITLDSAGCSV